MSPQQSYPPSCMFFHGMNSYGYMSTICILNDINALNITKDCATMIYSSLGIELVVSFIKHTFLCFEEWLRCCAFHLFHFRHPPNYKLMLLSVNLYTLIPPGMPP
jgi:hypothetical protein